MDLAKVTDAPDTAVQIGMDALTECGWIAHNEEGDGADSVARAVCIALARRGWLNDPDEIERDRDAARAEIDRLAGQVRFLTEEKRQLVVLCEAIGTKARSGEIPRFWEQR